MSYEDIYEYKDERITIDQIDHPNLTLEELKNITRKKALRLFRLGAKTENINRTQLIRSIIMAASRVQWSTTDPRGIREFWYNPVKPIFYRVYGKEIDDLGEDQIKAVCDVMSNIMSVMQQSNLFLYEDLGIEDFRTKRMLWESREGANCWSNIVVFVEKDSAWIHLRPLTKLLNITLLSGGGVSKTALNEVIMKKLPKGKYKLYTLTDYDPWGFFISGECFMKLKRMGWDLDVIRIGLDLDQVSKEITQNQKYPVKMDHKGQQWAPKYGVLGRLRTVYRTRKFTIKDPETGKKKKVEEKYLAYEGRKGWGIEIEAISGQETGAQDLRELVLTALFKQEYEELSTGEKKEIWKRLKETDRLDEIKTPLWEEVGWNKDTNPFSVDEWANYQKYGSADFDEIITEDDYDELKEGRDSVWEEDRKPVTDRAKLVIEENDFLKSFSYDLDREIKRSTDEASELATKCLDDQISELLRKKRIIKRKIENTWLLEEKKMGNWLLFNQLNLGLLASKYSEELKAIDDPYHDDIEELKGQKAISDSLKISTYIEWFDDVLKDLFVSKTNEEEELSFGLMPGVHMDVLKEGGTVSDLFSKVEEFDQDRIYNYIWDVSQDEEHENIIDLMAENLELYGDDNREREWHEKWDQYRESERRVSI